MRGAQVLQSGKPLAEYGLGRGSSALLDLVPFPASPAPVLEPARGLPSASPVLSSPEHGLVRPLLPLVSTQRHFAG